MQPFSPVLNFTWLGYLGAAGAALLAPDEAKTGYRHAWLCWALLCTLYLGRRCVLHRRLLDWDIRGRDVTAVARLWMVSLAIVAFTFASTFSGEASWLLPVVTTTVHLILLLPENRSLLSPVAGSSEYDIPKRWPSPAQLAGPAAIFLSIVATVFLFRQSGDLTSSPVSSVLRVCVWVCLGWSALSIRPTASKGVEAASTLAEGVTPRVFFVLTVSLALRRQIPAFSLAEVLVSLLSAAKWVAAFSMISSSASVSASTLDAFALFSVQAARTSQLDEWPILFFSAGVSLLQGIATLPKGTRHRGWLALLLLLPTIGVLRSGASIDLGYSIYDGTIGRAADVPVHPIQKLASEALKKHQDLVAKQSKNLGAAVVEYQRRYGRKPPPGFDAWFIAAKEKSYILIDEFDTLMKGLEPFWGVSPAVLRARVDSVTQTPEARLFRYTVKDSRFSVENDTEAAWITDQIRFWLSEDVLNTLPDMVFAVNILDEPRVVPTYEELDKALKYSSDGVSRENSTESGESLSTTAIFKGPDVHGVWDRMTASCDPKSPARRAPSRFKLPHKSLSKSFVSNLTIAQDVCLMPDLQIQHGFFIAPETASIAPTLVPIFSQARPSSFRDILFPSIYYGAKLEHNEYMAGQDMDWDRKENIVYWTGSSTGGHTNIFNWKTFQRQRLVLTISNNATRIGLMKKLPEGLPRDSTLKSIWRTYTSKMEQVVSYLRVRITAVIQCDEDACIAQKAAFQPDKYPKEDYIATYAARYNLDIDGNGFSGRYLRGLLSKSAMMKQTMFKEWIDDWLMPWVHYIPVSMDLTEFPELVRYFVSEPEGQELGKSIAEASTQWAKKSLRREDLKLAFWRVMLEYARVSNDDRDSMTCCS